MFMTMSMEQDSLGNLVCVGLCEAGKLPLQQT